MSAERCVRKSAALSDLLGSVEGGVQRLGGSRGIGRRSFVGCSSLLLTGPAALLFRLTLLQRIHVRRIPRHWFKLPVTVAGASLCYLRFVLGAGGHQSFGVQLIIAAMWLDLVMLSSQRFSLGADLWCLRHHLNCTRTHMLAPLCVRLWRSLQLRCSLRWFLHCQLLTVCCVTSSCGSNSVPSTFQPGFH